MLRDRLAPGMETGRVLKLAAYYRLLATLSFVVGFGIVGAGFALGIWPMIEHMLNNAPQNFDESLSRAQPVVFVALSAVGILIWQFGKSIAFVKAISSAAEAGTDDAGVDTEALRAEVGDVVDDRLAAADLSGDAGDAREATGSRRHSATTATGRSATGDALGYDQGGTAETEYETGDDGAYDATAESGFDTGDEQASYDTGDEQTAYDDTGGASTDEFDTTGSAGDAGGAATGDDDVGGSASEATDEATTGTGETAGTEGGDDPLAAGSDEAGDDSDDEWRPSE